MKHLLQILLFLPLIPALAAEPQVRLELAPQDGIFRMYPLAADGSPKTVRIELRASSKSPDGRDLLIRFTAQDIFRKPLVPFWPAANCWAYKEVWVHPASRWLWIVGDLLPSRALRPEPLPDCGFTLATDTAADGKITIRLSARGQGRHRFTVRAENLAISDLNHELDLKRDGSMTAQWTATVVNAKAPWVAVVIPDGNLAQRREVTAKINPP
jgi:hypothetical protein